MSLEQAAEAIRDCLKKGRKVMLCGNGGSCADAQHIAAELVGRFAKERRAFAAVALADPVTITAIGNDYGFGEIFKRQVEGIGQEGDCLIGISTSGQSENVRRAMHKAGQMGIKTIGLLGRDGGEIARHCEIAIIVPLEVTARIQEQHIIIGHRICELIDE